MNEADIRAIVRAFRDIQAKVEQLERRQNNVVREGKVTKIDPATGMAEVVIDGLPSRALPWAQRAGQIKDWNPPSVGERVLVISPTGEPGNGIIFPGGWSSDNPAPHDKAGDRKMVISGDLIIEAKRIFMKTGQTTFELTDAGLKAYAQDYEFE